MCFLEVEKNISRIEISRGTKARKMISRGLISSENSFEEKDTRDQKKISRSRKLEIFLRGISSRFFLNIVHLEVFVPRIYICILEDAFLIKKIFLYNNHLFVLKVDKSILRINWKFIKLLKLKYRIITKICIKNISN